MRSQAQLVEQLRVYDARVSTNAAEVAVKFEFTKTSGEEARQSPGGATTRLTTSMPSSRGRTARAWAAVSCWPGSTSRGGPFTRACSVCRWRPSTRGP